MPAPAVYVIAILGTVGAAIAFKQFIYPHIAPRIDRWKVEFQAARRRRAEADVMSEVALLQRGKGKDRNSDDDDSDDDQSDEGFRKGTTTLRAPIQPYMKNGLLIRRRSQASPTKSGDVELDDWITGASDSQQSDLRNRKNIGSSNESLQPIHNSTTIRTASGHSSQTRQPIGLELNKTNTHALLDESIQPISYTPLSPILTPTPTHVLYDSSSTHSPLDSPSSKSVSPPLPEERPKTDVITSHPLLPPLQPLSPLLCIHDVIKASASKAEPSPRSPSGPENIVPPISDMSVPSGPLLLPLDVDSTTTANNSLISAPPIIHPSEPSAPTLSSRSLSPTGSHLSSYQTPPHVHVIPSLSQSYPLDDLLDYEHGLELLSPPSPLSRADSPFEFAGLSPRPEIGAGATLLLARSEDTPTDNIINNPMRGTTFLSFSSPALSASSVFPSSENGYENDSNQSEFSSTFSSPVAAPTRLGDIGSQSLPPQDHTRLSRSISPLSPRSSLSSDVSYRHNQRGQQQERNTGSRPLMPASPIETTKFQEYDDYADTQTLSPRNQTRSPWTMMNGGTATESIMPTSIPPEIRPIESTARLPRVDSDFDTGSELSDLDFLSMSAEEYQSSALAPAIGGSGLSGMDGRSGVVGRRVGGIGGSGIRDGNESDTSSWSFAGGSE